MNDLGAVDYDLQNNAMGTQHKMLAGSVVDQNELQRGQCCNVYAAGWRLVRVGGSAEDRHSGVGKPGNAYLEGASSRVSERSTSPMTGRPASQG